jgi:hypothetical protein
MSGYLGPAPVPQATQTRQTFTATASQTSFATGGYQAGYLDVFLNGVKLVDGTDYTATNGSDVVLTTGAASGDTLEVVAYTAFEVLNQTFTGTTTVDVLNVTGAATGTDLTLSGGVYLGGTGSANYLNDYEEGTWTPVISDATSGGNIGSATIAFSTYTKIGNAVYLKAQIINIDTTGLTGSSNLYVQGLPFVADGTSFGLLNSAFVTGSANCIGVNSNITDGSNYLRTTEKISGGSYLVMDVSQFSSGAADIWISITYHAG